LDLRIFHSPPDSAINGEKVSEKGAYTLPHGSSARG
jgi:hypothetical protein